MSNAVKSTDGRTRRDDPVLTEIIRNGEWTGATPGAILKPGEATRTVPIPADMKDVSHG